MMSITLCCSSDRWRTTLPRVTYTRCSDIIWFYFKCAIITFILLVTPVIIPIIIEKHLARIYCFISIIIIYLHCSDKLFEEYLHARGDTGVDDSQHSKMLTRMHYLNVWLASLARLIEFVQLNQWLILWQYA
jgi:hypothetical protein